MMMVIKKLSHINKIDTYRSQEVWQTVCKGNLQLSFPITIISEFNCWTSFTMTYICITVVLTVKPKFYRQMSYKPRFTYKYKAFYVRSIATPVNALDLITFQKVNGSMIQELHVAGFWWHWVMPHPWVHPVQSSYNHQ